MASPREGTDVPWVWTGTHQCANPKNVSRAPTHVKQKNEEGEKRDKAERIKQHMDPKPPVERGTLTASIHIHQHYPSKIRRIAIKMKFKETKRFRNKKKTKDPKPPGGEGNVYRE